MQTALENHLNNLLKNTIYGFILLENIKEENVRDTAIPFHPSCEPIEYDDADGSFLKPNDQGISDVMLMFPAFSEEGIGITISIPKPEPKKVFTDVNNNILPSKESNIQIREIREQLTSTSHSDLITCEGKDYVIEVEKGDNTANYYLYFPDEYWSFTGSLKKSFLEICKRWNDKQHTKATQELNGWMEKHENSESQKRIKYINEVIGKFDVWYYENEFTSPSLQPIETTKEGGFKTTENKNYTKVGLPKKADIYISAALRAYPKAPTFAELENESKKKIKTGYISKTTWWNLQDKIIFWQIIIAEIDGRLQSERKLKQVTIEKLISIKSIRTVDLTNLEIRKEYENRKSSGDIFEEMNDFELIEDNMSYIKTKKDKPPELGDNKDDQEAKELEDYGKGGDKTLGLK